MENKTDTMLLAGLEGHYIFDPDNILYKLAKKKSCVIHFASSDITFGLLNIKATLKRFNMLRSGSLFCFFSDTTSVKIIHTKFI